VWQAADSHEDALSWPDGVTSMPVPDPLAALRRYLYGAMPAECKLDSKSCLDCDNCGCIGCVRGCAADYVCP
jgi:hypothetical protein